jgi:hypothetical protein
MIEQPVCGDVLCSPVSDARFLVIDAGAAIAMPSVDGVPMSRGKLQGCSAAGGAPTGGDLHGGRRYTDPTSGLTLLCIRPGRGRLCHEGRRLIPESNRRTRLPVSASPA